MESTATQQPRMALQVAIGHSADIEGPRAIDEAMASAEGDLDGRTPVAGLLLASVEYDHGELLERVLARWPGIQITGGTTDGELSSVGGFLEDSVLLILFAGEGLSARAVSATGLSVDPGAAVAQAIGELDERRPKLILSIFAPSTDASDVLARIDRELGERSAPVVGGLTGDHREFEKMSEFHGGRVQADSLTLLALYGDFQASWGTASGWFPVGERLRVTKSEGHVVQRIGDRTAIEAYRHYYSEVGDVSLSEYPLALFTDADSNEFIMRAVLASDPEAGTLTFAGAVPEGALVSMTEVVERGVLDGARESLEQALQAYPGVQPRFALLFSCAARQWVLGGKASEELEIVRAALPARPEGEFPIAGFYCFGEVVPSATTAGSLLHNETCVSLILGD